MREKELRIALICFGGVSLAVYMHGISKEVLKLVRASSALHAIPDRAARLGSEFAERPEAHGRDEDTESIYFALLREIGRKIDLRVIVDIVAGASAGGINGTMLARALAHDLPMDGLRDLWLEEADVTTLLAPEARAKAWSKWFLIPFIWGFSAVKLLHDIADPEVRRKISLFVRSRWFKPPFDGRRMARLMYDAIACMGEPADPTRSLLPAGQRLDLFVTLTDHYGYQQMLETHDPPVIEEREHRHILKFSCRRWPDGEIETDFDLDNAPALAFAARATSSFPGVFPPAQIAEMDRLLAESGIVWPRRQEFLERNFVPYLRVGSEPAGACFLDGSVLNDKPFREAISAIRGRPAYRQVDRRLVYVDPDPERPHPPPPGHIPGFFTTLRSALSDIPRNEPIADELGWVSGFNERVRRLKGIVDAARPQITRLVTRIVAPAPAEVLDAERIRSWRETVSAHAARDAGFAYEGYVRLKLTSVRALVGQMIVGLLGLPPLSPAAHTVLAIVDRWGMDVGIVYENGGESAAVVPRWVKFLLSFDVDFRKRRLYFLIQGQNRLYEMLDDSAAGSAAARLVDGLKREFYQSLDTLRHRESPDFFSAEAAAMARALFGGLPADTAWREGEVTRFAAAEANAIAALIDRLAAEIDLDASTNEIDGLLATMHPRFWPTDVRREVLVNYLGFPFWDVLTLSVTNWRDIGEFDEILVDRISWQDARMLAQLGLTASLKGTGMAHFAAFFSRGYRENDYLLGRLHGVDRMIDIVCDAAGVAQDAGFDAAGFKRRAFMRILDAEEKHLPQSAALVGALRRALAG